MVWLLWAMRRNNEPIGRQSHRSACSTDIHHEKPQVGCLACGPRDEPRTSWTYNSTSPAQHYVVCSHYSLRCGCCSPQFHNPINISTDSCWSGRVETTVAHCSAMFKVLLLQDKQLAHLTHVTRQEISAESNISCILTLLLSSLSFQHTPTGLQSVMFHCYV
jgi:hypothetical protein